MTAEDVIDGILKREGGFVDHPADRGSATNWGITAGSWGEYKQLGRKATAAEVKAITRDEARGFYFRRYIHGQSFMSLPEELTEQVIDIAVNSGTSRAVAMLQKVLAVPQTGKLDADTFVAVRRDRPALVNAALVAARVQFYHGIVKRTPSQGVFLRGWINRAVEFLAVLAFTLSAAPAYAETHHCPSCYRIDEKRHLLQDGVHICEHVGDGTAFRIIGPHVSDADATAALLDPSIPHRDCAQFDACIGVYVGGSPTLRVNGQPVDWDSESIQFTWTGTRTCHTRAGKRTCTFEELTKR